MVSTDEPTLLDKVATIAPASLAKFDAFPKLTTTYRSRSESRGFMTVFVTLLAALLLLNDVGEFIWGWPDYEFSVDRNIDPNLEINLDMVVAMPCGAITVDLRDAVGDRLLLSGSLRRDGTFFDVGQATKLKEHADALSVSQAIAQSRKSRGLFDWLPWNKKSGFKPRYNYQSDGTACRITGSLSVKRVTANLHITALGHGYASYEHVDHQKMNLSHIITEFSFGPFFPEIVQPLDNSYELTDGHFVAYHYFLHVVPTTYIPPRSFPLSTAQYSVTHYTREVSHEGTPGIFFKFDLDPLAITIHQRTTTFLQLLIRCVGVLGGVFVCMGYAIRVTNKAVKVVTGGDDDSSIVAAESSGVSAGRKWGGGELRSRKVVPQGSGWTLEGSATGSPYPGYTGSPALSSYSPSLGSATSQSPYLAPATLPGYSPRPRSPNPNIHSPALRSASSSSSTPLGVPPLGTRSVSANSAPFSSTSTLELELPGNGQDALRPPTPYKTFTPSSPQPAQSALPPVKGKKDD